MNIEYQKGFYDSLWSQRAKLNSLNLRRAIKILDFFCVIKKRIPIPKVIDLGCGDGRFSSFLGEFAEVEGLELSEQAVANANTLYPHVNYFQGDALTYDFKSKTYDVIISQEVIEHIEDQKAYLDVCHKILKDEGYLILTTPNKKVLDHMTNGSTWSNQPIENVLTPFALKELISTKFKIINYDSIVYNFGDKGYFKLLNSRYVIGFFNILQLHLLRTFILGKLGYGLHQCILAKKYE